MSRLDPVFFEFPEEALRGWSESMEDEIILEQFNDMESESEGNTDSRSIDYGDEDSQQSSRSSNTSTTLDLESEAFQFQQQHPLVFVTIQAYQIQSNTLDSEETEAIQIQNRLKKLKALLEACIAKSPEKEIESEEDYITSSPFLNGEHAVVATSTSSAQPLTYWKYPMHISTVRKLLDSGNFRNPCDNNPLEGFILVKIKHQV